MSGTNTLAFDLNDREQVQAYIRMIAELNRECIPYKLTSDKFTMWLEIPMDAY